MTDPVPATFTLAASTLNRLLSGVLPLAAARTNHSARPLAQVYFHLTRGSLTALATDRYRLGMHRVDMGKGIIDPEVSTRGRTFSISAEALVMVQRVFGRGTRKFDPSLTVTVFPDHTVGVQAQDLFATPYESKGGASPGITLRFPRPDGVEVKFARQMVKLLDATSGILTSRAADTPAMPAVLNARYLADLAAVHVLDGRTANTPVVIQPAMNGSGSMLLSLADEYVLMLMQVRTGEATDAAAVLAHWTEALESLRAVEDDD